MLTKSEFSLPFLLPVFLLGVTSFVGKSLVSSGITGGLSTLRDLLWLPVSPGWHAPARVAFPVGGRPLRGGPLHSVSPHPCLVLPWRPPQCLDLDLGTHSLFPDPTFEGVETQAGPWDPFLSVAAQLLRCPDECRGLPQRGSDRLQARSGLGGTGHYSETTQTCF